MCSIHFYRKYIAIALLLSTCESKQHVWDSIKQTKSPVCETKECKELSQSLVEGMNTKADPCTNFYDYVCGRWAEHNPVPPNVGEWSANHIMRTKTIHDLRKLLEKKDNMYDGADVVQARKVYKACVSIPSLQRGNADFIKIIVKGIANWILHLSVNTPKAHDGMTWMLDNYYLKMTGESAFFDVKMISNYQKQNSPLLLLQPPQSAYGSIFRSTDWTDDEKYAYSKFLREIAGVLTLDKKPLIPKTTMKMDIENVFKFRRNLNKVLLKFRRNLNKLINENNENDVCKYMMLHEVQRLYDSTAKKPASKINWMEHGRVLHSNLITKKFDKNMPITLCQEEYFKKLGLLLSDADELTIGNHIHLYFVERHLYFNPHEKSLLSSAISSNMQQLTPRGQIRYDTERWQKCIKYHNMRNTIAKMYADAYFVKETKASVEKLIERIKAIMTMQIYESSWLGEITSEHMMDKIKHSVITYSYSKLTTYPVLTSPANSPTDILNINTAIANSRSELILNVPALQFPMHSPSLPYVVNHARIGFLIGNEMYSMLRKEEKVTRSSPNRIWLPRNLQNKFNQRSKCFAEQYKDYVRRGIAQPSVPNYLLKYNDLVVEENTADTMGLKATYDAFKKQMWKKKGECTVLPQFEKTNCEKLFFILFGSQFCTIISPNILQKYFDKNSHSLPEFRLRSILEQIYFLSLSPIF
ncbi:hypothetical protein KM043_015063 [Ampulex compressa]|nr:hypothetical protein KM043_015063 [Ampulex compressa]